MVNQDGWRRRLWGNAWHVDPPGKRLILRPGTTAPADARRFVRRLMRDPQEQETAALVVSELVTNAVNYSDGPVELTVRQAGDQTRIEVSDTNPEAPTVREPDQQGGRGLHVLHAVAERWGVDAHANGKTVWFELASTGTSKGVGLA